VRIVFVEPGASGTPVGGTKVVYEYANRLAARRHQVSVIHPVKLEPARRLSKALRLGLRYLGWSLGGRWKPSRWMTVDERVEMRWTRDLAPSRFPAADVVIATTWNTVEPILRLPADRGRKVFFSQHWDFGYAPDDKVLAAWRGAEQRIVINRSAGAAAGELGLDADYVPNGLDPAAFGIDTPLEGRDPFHVALLFHGAPHKGVNDALAALELARAQAPQLSAEMFSGQPRPADLPDWIAFNHKPADAELRALYNRASVFVSASHNEGWGLTPCEAGLCGCALAVTDNFGHREFAIDQETALVSAPGDPEALATNVVRLASDAELRVRTNAALREKLAAFSWERSVEMMEAALTGPA